MLQEEEEIKDFLFQFEQIVSLIEQNQPFNIYSSKEVKTLEDIGDETDKLQQWMEAISVSSQIPMKDKILFWIILCDWFGLCVIDSVEIEPFLQSLTIDKCDAQSIQLVGLLIQIIQNKVDVLFRTTDYSDLKQILCQIRTNLKITKQIQSYNPRQNQFEESYLKFYSMHRYYATKNSLNAQDSSEWNEILKLFNIDSSRFPKQRQIDQVKELQKLQLELFDLNEMLEREITYFQSKSCLNSIYNQQLDSLLDGILKELKILKDEYHVSEYIRQKRIDRKLTYSMLLFQISKKELNQYSSFNFNEQLSQDESQLYEFKDYRWPFDLNLRQKLKEVVCSFLNTMGGYLFIGINDFKEVKGIRLTYKQRDELKLNLQADIESIKPKVDLHQGKIKIDFLPIKSEGQTIPGLFVVRVLVQQGRNDRVYAYMEKSHVEDYNGTKTFHNIKAVLRLDAKKQTVLFPDFLELTYDQAKNPRNQAPTLQAQEPEPIIDLKDGLEKQKKNNKRIKQVEQEAQQEKNYPKWQVQPQSITTQPVPVPRPQNIHKTKIHLVTESNTSQFLALMNLYRPRTPNLSVYIQNILSGNNIQAKIYDTYLFVLLVEFNNPRQLTKFWRIYQQRSKEFQTFSYKNTLQVGVPQKTIQATNVSKNKSMKLRKDGFQFSYDEEALKATFKTDSEQNFCRIYDQLKQIQGLDIVVFNQPPTVEAN